MDINMSTATHIDTFGTDNSSKSHNLTISPQNQLDQPVASRTRRLSSNNCALEFKEDTLTQSDMMQRQLEDAPSIKQIAAIYQKDPSIRMEQEASILKQYAFLIPDVRCYIKTKREKELLKQRLIEVEESLESIKAKTHMLAALIKTSKHVVVYTGAGISTSASIPDYRGPNGLWTQIKKTGTYSITNMFDLSSAEPTYTHMALKELSRRRMIKHVVSQNCDGLHLRSGITQTHLSEIHGNMYIEICPSCEKQYYREADVTQRTSRFRHKTGRKCHTCAEPNNSLVDTIVLYGERSRTKWPMNWDRAGKAAKNADLIICMGSSLKTLKRYSCLWPKSLKSETKLVIINLQHTSKDKNAVLKISGKCDLVMQNLMERLNINVPLYSWKNDPLLTLSIPFSTEELIDLKRNLIFRRKQEQQCDDSMKRYEEDCESRYSPSLFVSEMTDDPDRKRLRMRIRAVNVGATGSCNTSYSDNDAKVSENKSDEKCIKLEQDEQVIADQNIENLSQMIVENHQHIDYAPPGWLGKSLGYAKSSSYRRKRHGNKGKKRTPLMNDLD